MNKDTLFSSLFIQVTQSVVGTVNNLMEIEENELEQTEQSSSVVTSLEQQVSNVQKNPENFTDVQDNVGVQAVKLDPDITNGITFVNFWATDDTGQIIPNADLTEENTQLYNENQEIRRENTSASIHISSHVLELALSGNQVVLSNIIFFHMFVLNGSIVVV